MVLYKLRGCNPFRHDVHGSVFHTKGLVTNFYELFLTFPPEEIKYFSDKAKVN